MTVDSYIVSIIDSHSEKWDIYFSEETSDYIKMHVKTGIIACGIKYEPSLGKRLYQVNNIIPLDWTKVKSEDIYDRDGTFINTLWSRGDQFQYSTRETLVFNPSIIRDIKLNSIINK